MARLELEFARRRDVPWVGLVFLVAAAAVACVVLWRWYLETEAVDRLEQQVQSARRALEDGRQAQAKEASSPDAIEKKKRDDQIIAALSYPWNRVFAEFEQAQEEKVAVLSFSHDRNGKQIEVVVEAIDVPTLQKYVEKLNEGLDEKPWYIATYQLQQQNNPLTVKATIPRSDFLHLLHFGVELQ